MVFDMLNDKVCIQHKSFCLTYKATNILLDAGIGQQPP